LIAKFVIYEAYTYFKPVIKPLLISEDTEADLAISCYLRLGTMLVGACLLDRHGHLSENSITGEIDRYAQ
jgi:hypothetical protein